MNFDHWFIIMGTPCSGVSLLSRCLEIAGMRSPAPGNPGDADSINALLLQDLGLSPFMAGPLPDNWKQSKAADKARERIRALLTACHPPDQPCFLPGNLLCRVLPLWMEIFREYRILFTCVHILRHPWEVAQSLADMGHMDLYKAHHIWLAYVRDCLRHCPDQTLVTFDQLLADPVTTLNTLWQNAPRSLVYYVQPCLKHHHAAGLFPTYREKFRVFENLYQHLRLGMHAGQDPELSVQNQDPMAGFQENSNSVFRFHPDTVSPDLVDSLLERIGRYEIKEQRLPVPESRIQEISRTGQALFSTVIIPQGSDADPREIVFPLLPDQWQKITVHITRTDLLSKVPLRLRPLNCPGMAAINSIRFVSQATGRMIQSFTGPGDFKNTVQGTALQVPDRHNLVVLITGSHGEILLPSPNPLPDCPLDLHIRIKPGTRQESLLNILKPLVSADNWHVILDTDPDTAEAQNYREMARSFSDTGYDQLADTILQKGVDHHHYPLDFMTDYAEISMKMHNWPEAVRRWQLIADKHGPDTPSCVYDRLDHAYGQLKSFPGGTPQEELRQGDINYMELLARIHKELNPERYLEIGVQTGKSLALAGCVAIGVDPMPRLEVSLPDQARIFRMTSDDFFRDQAEKVLEKPPDLVFIDGMHLFEYTLRDFINVERFSSPATLVVIDDILPNHPAQAERVRRTRAWTGDVWKVHSILSRHRPDLALVVVNTSPTGLLLIAGLNPSDNVLKDRYQDMVNQYSTITGVPEPLLNRKNTLPPAHPMISEILALLKTGRKENWNTHRIRQNLTPIIRNPALREHTVKN